MSKRWAWTLVVGLVGCVEPKGDGAEGEVQPEGSTTAAEPEEEESSTSATPPEPEEESSSSEGSEESTTGCNFICDDPPEHECDVWAQDCPEGEKCAPWISDGGAAWNALKCVPVEASGGQPGDECTTDGGGASGLDSCAIGSMCWNVDEEGNGTCVAFCEGSQENPSCADASATCVIANDGVLIVCLPICDPLIQDCGGGEACYPVGDAFACGPDVSGELGLFGDPCEAINVCDAGMFCASPQLVPDCQGSSGCCTSFCDLEDDGACPGEGQDCVSWFDEGQAPPGAETLGACISPE
jgi:hypothetical protein